MSTPCVIPGRPHQASSGLLICQFHLDEIGTWLIDIEQEFDNLDARPSMEIRWDSGGSSLAFERAPVRIAAVAANDRRRVADEDIDNPAGFDRQGLLSVYETLHRWAQRVRTERSLTHPTLNWVERMPGSKDEGPACEKDCTHHTCQALVWRRSRPARLNVRTERALLFRHLETWIAFQPWVNDLHRELRALREQVKAVNGTSDPKPLSGRCPRFDDDGSSCLGRLWPVKPTHTSGTFITTDVESVYAVQCERNHTHVWEGMDLVRLSLILEESR